MAEEDVLSCFLGTKTSLFIFWGGGSGCPTEATREDPYRDCEMPAPVGMEELPMSTGINQPTGAGFCASTACILMHPSLPKALPAFFGHAGGASR